MLNNYKALKALAWKYRQHWIWGDIEWILRNREGTLIALWVSNGWLFLRSSPCSNAKYFIQLNFLERWLAWRYLRKLQVQIIAELEFMENERGDK